MKEREVEQKNMTDAQKMSAFLKNAGDVPEKYWGLVDLDSIAIDPETNQPDQLSLQKSVESFKATFPETIIETGGPRLPNNAAKPGKTLTVE